MNLLYGDTLIIFINGMMCVGGIETYIYNLSNYSIANGAKIILQLNRHGIIDEVYQDVFSSPGVYIMRNIYTSEHEIKSIIKSNNIKCIKIISFDLYGFSIAERLKDRFSNYEVSSFFFVPHFKGAFIFLEENFSGILKKYMYKRVTKMINKMQNNFNIRYFAPLHIKTFQEKYNLRFLKDFDYRVPFSKIENNKFDENRCAYLWRRKEFNILAISRFEFPHKGYLLGLVDAFFNLKIKYPFLTFTIVGYGRDQEILDQKISELPEEIKKDIRMVGKVNPTELVYFYNEANVNVSVAGCYKDGVKNGTLSIPARHYTNNCEVYGVSPEANQYAVSNEPGYNPEELLEKIINMNEDEYIQACRDTFYSMNKTSDMDRCSIFNCFNKTTKTISFFEQLMILYTYLKKGLGIKLHLNKI